MAITANGQWNHDDDDDVQLSKWIISVRNRANITICNFTICIEPNDIIISKFWDMHQVTVNDNRRYKSPSWLQLASMGIYESGIIVIGNLSTLTPISIIEHYDTHCDNVQD